MLCQVARVDSEKWLSVRWFVLLRTRTGPKMNVAAGLRLTILIARKAGKERSPSSERMTKD